MEFLKGEESAPADIDEFWGLPTPPLDEEALFINPCPIMDLSNFFDDIDDNGNLQKVAPRHGRGKELATVKRALMAPPPPRPPRHGRGKDLETVKRALGIIGEDSSLEVKFETTKRKVHDAYTKIENAKKQRRIQVIDIQCLPKQQGSCRKKPYIGHNFKRPFLICQH